MNCHYVHVDCQVHVDYVKNMITGDFRMDGETLGVSAAHDSMPQTQEHILLVKQVGVPYLAVFVSKVDQVDVEEILELVQFEVRGLLVSHDSLG